MEIERKYLVNSLPASLSSYPCRKIQQAYLCTEPVVRIRREDDSYYLTYKSKGLMVRQEYNLPLTAESYSHLLSKADGNVISKVRFLIPLDSLNLTAELDLFEGAFLGLALVEVEFPNEEEARSFLPPLWFGRDVTFTGEFQNSRLSSMNQKEIASTLSEITVF